MVQLIRSQEIKMKKFIAISLLFLFTTGFHYRSSSGSIVKWGPQHVVVYYCKEMKRIKTSKLTKPFKKWQKRLKNKITFSFKWIKKRFFQRGIIICFDSKWNRIQGDDAYAVTTTEWITHSGKIINAEIFFNTKTFKWVRKRSRKELVNFESILLHEIGHALGLKHSRNSRSVMYARPHPRYARKTLHKEDIRKIKKLYNIK